MSKTSAYLTQRVKQALRTDELKIKDLGLDVLMTAYASVYEHGDAGNDQRITMKIPALATHYAQLLNQGKFVVIRDPFENRQYFVIAHHEDLIAVCYAIGPWSNIYNIKCTSEDTLRELNITTPITTDLKVIDRLFGFRPWNSEGEEEHTPPTAIVHQDSGVHWQWHSGHKPAGKEAVGPAPVEGEHMTEVSAPGHLVDLPGAPAPSDRAVELATPGENQMTRAFQSAGQGRREERRHGGRRQHDQQHGGHKGQ
uniref:Uncharacterized protein n=1 Tax=Burkholderia phage vB_BgluM-SURPRISE13 TaxID=3159457 RepID=A0AAU7PFN8_9VIRU